jgi:glutamate-1-semialdehyde 2,1-aminomutase
LLEENKNEVAALIVEPVVGNMGCVLPHQYYLQGLRDLCTKHEVVLIFDEVMTGFRLAPGGAQELYGITPDMTTLGKIIGGGLPVGAYGGRKEIMDIISPVGKVYQAGTLSGNPLAMAAGYALLTYLKFHPEVYDLINTKTKKITDGLRTQISKHNIGATVNHIGSMFTLFFTNENVVDLKTANTSDTVAFSKYFQSMLSKGIYMAPSQFEAMFISAAVNEEMVLAILAASDESFAALLS